MDPYRLISLQAAMAGGNRHDKWREKSSSAESQGRVLRLRGCFAKRSSHCAQDDSASEL